MTTRVKRRVHGLLTVMWALLIIPAILWWRDSVPFLVLCSVYANLAGHWAAFEASTPFQEGDFNGESS